MTVEHRHILAPTDFSDQSRAALLVARDYAEKFSAKLTVAHVLHLATHLLGDGVYVRDEVAREMELAAHRELDKLVALIDTNIIVTGCVVLKGAPHEVIPRYAKESAADLIVISTHGRTGLASVAFGSVTQRVIVASPCRVLVLPAARP